MGIFAKLIKSATGELDWMDATIVADDEFRFWVEIVGREAFSGPIDYPMLLLSFYGQTRFLIHSRNPSMAEANFHLRQLMDHVTGHLPAVMRLVDHGEVLSLLPGDDEMPVTLHKTYTNFFRPKTTKAKVGFIKGDPLIKLERPEDGFLQQQVFGVFALMQHICNISPRTVRNVMWKSLKAMHETLPAEFYEGVMNYGRMPKFIGTVVREAIAVERA